MKRALLLASSSTLLRVASVGVWFAEKRGADPERIARLRSRINAARAKRKEAPPARP